MLKTRADEALKAKADAEGSLATLHHRHADMEVPPGLPPPTQPFRWQCQHFHVAVHRKL